MGSTRGSLRLLKHEKPQLTLPLPGTSSQRYGGCGPVFPGLPARQTTSGQQVARRCGRVAGRGCWPVAWGPGLGLLPTPVFTRRARSSPRHARGLNVAHFLRPCRPPSAAKAAGWRQGMRRGKNLRFPALEGLLRGMGCIQLRGAGRGRFSERVISAICGQTDPGGRAVRGF